MSGIHRGAEPIAVPKAKKLPGTPLGPELIAVALLRGPVFGTRAGQELTAVLMEKLQNGIHPGRELIAKIFEILLSNQGNVSGTPHGVGVNVAITESKRFGILHGQGLTAK